MKKKSLILTIIFLAILLLVFSANIFAESDSWKSSANGRSKKVTYHLKATATRKSRTTVGIHYELTFSWPDGKEGKHTDYSNQNYPTKITVTLSAPGWSQSTVVKEAGSQSMKKDKYSGDLTINVKPHDSSTKMHIEANGSGHYYDKVKHTRTYYTTKTVTYSISHTYVPPRTYYVTRGDNWKLHLAYKDAVAASKVTVKEKHTETYYTKEKRSTNSGTLSKKSLKLSFQPWADVFYNTLSDGKIYGAPNPPLDNFKRQSNGTWIDTTYVGFINPQSTKVTYAVPKWWDPDIEQYGYRCVGWTRTSYNISALYTGYEPPVQYTAGSSVGHISGDSAAADINLYAVYRANDVAMIIYHANTGDEEDEEYVKKNIPSQTKKYRIPIKLAVDANGLPLVPQYHQEENVGWNLNDDGKAYRHVFLYWSTVEEPNDETNPGQFGKEHYRSGDSFNYDKCPTHGIQRDKSLSSKELNIIHMYAIWHDEYIPVKDETANPDNRIRYIDKENINSLTEDSKWRTGNRYDELNESLNKGNNDEGYKDANHVYDSQGNLIRDNNTY